MTPPRSSHPACPSPRRRGAAGFSLVEVMISVALVLFLIIGVNQVFKMTTDTVGAGQVMSSNVRDTRAAQAVLFGDLGSAVMQTPPAFIISSSRVSAFRNKADRESAITYATAGTEPSIRVIDLDNNGTEGEATVFGEVI